MNNILITGGNGFIGLNLLTFLKNKNNNCFSGTRKNINLSDINDIKSFIENKKINIIIHTAFEKEDNIQSFYNNLLIFQNLAQCTHYYKNLYLINIGSSDEFGQELGIMGGDFIQLYNIKPPKAYYGLAKFIISKQIASEKRIANLRLFRCFYYNEHYNKFIRSNIERYIKNEKMIIYKDRAVDYIYFDDFANVVLYFIDKKPECPLMNDISIGYPDGKIVYLSDITDIINCLSDHKVPVVIENDEIDAPCVGCSNYCHMLDIPWVGLEEGIKNVYKKLK